VALSNVLAPTLDASQTVGGINKLCRKSRFGKFAVEKPNYYSLLELHEKWLNSKYTWLSLENSTGMEGKFDRQ
jgi:hypothetical protein